MAKTQTGFDEHGEFSGAKKTRHQRKSEQLIGWTKGPTTRRAKIARSLWG
ncbi:MAG: hypothetical protein ABW046_20725 [Actinoplanes sp.]